MLAFDATTGAQVTEIRGEHNLDAMGIGVAGFVDLTGDGRGEFLVGAPGTNDLPTLFSAGSAFVYSCTNLPRPDVAVVPNPLNFGTVAVGSTQQLALEIRNNGDVDLHVAGLSLAPGSSAAFGLAGPAGAFTLPPSGKKSVNVAFAPTTPAGHAGEPPSPIPDSPTYKVFLAGYALHDTATPAGPSPSAGPAAPRRRDGGAPSRASSHLQRRADRERHRAGGRLVGRLRPERAAWRCRSRCSPARTSTSWRPSRRAVVGARACTLQIASDDPASPTVPVGLSATGAAPNQPPTAVIKMDEEQDR